MTDDELLETCNHPRQLGSTFKNPGKCLYVDHFNDREVICGSGSDALNAEDEYSYSSIKYSQLPPCDGHERVRFV